LKLLPKWEKLVRTRVFAKSSLKNFWDRPGCGDARGPLHSWYDEVVKAAWASPQDVKDQHASASICGNNRVVFNIECIDMRPLQ
jgi:mRNA interferase HigB